KGAVKVIAANDATICASLIALDGRTLATAKGYGAATLSTAGYQGVALVQVVANGVVEVTKVIVR
ncbi:MAG: hypothetical protein J6U43_01360, partial [Bacteroidales bacterium]|nr:hypothetical protein [Bacteroidales bacterium]